MINIQINRDNFEMKKYSIFMKIISWLGLKQISWSLRRLHVPVESSDLVLEIGSGGNPYPRSNVLLDAAISSKERPEIDLISDRPLVIGIAECMPFKDKAFDFVIASHILEHSSEPIKFISEIQRVSKAGYIETPIGWFEQLSPFIFHRLEIKVYKNTLYIKKKSSWKYSDFSNEWEENIKNTKLLYKFILKNPEIYHVRFYWENKIDYEIINNEVDCSWDYNEFSKEELIEKKYFLSKAYRYLRRLLFSQNKRNKNIQILDLIICPCCKLGELKKDNNKNLICNKCRKSFPFKDEIPVLFPEKLDSANKQRLI